jgi:hypothetical protein
MAGPATPIVPIPASRVKLPRVPSPVIKFLMERVALVHGRNLYLIAIRIDAFVIGIVTEQTIWTAFRLPFELSMHASSE